MDDTCAMIPSAIEDVHGYHRDCYRRFQRNIERLKEDEQDI